MSTINAKLNDGIFDAMLKVACEEVINDKITAWDSADTDVHEFSQEFEQKMKKLLHSQARQARVISTRKILSRVAVIMLAVMAFGFTITMSVEALRVQFFNTITDFAEEHIGFSFQRQAEQPVADIIVYPDYIPDWYWEAEMHDMLDNIRIIFRDDYGGRIIFDRFIMSEGLNVQIDSEYTNAPYFLNINGVYVQVFESNVEDQESYIVWDDGSTFFKLAGTVQFSELIEMARSMIS